MKRRRPSYDKNENRDTNGHERLREERATILKNKFGYADTNNPFNDLKLSKPFVWKKRDKSSSTGEFRVERNVSKLASPNERELLEELSHIRQRREERELDDKQRDELRSRTSHERETQNYDEWQRIEDRFHREVSKLRAKLHIEENREDIFHYFLKTFELGVVQHHRESHDGTSLEDKLPYVYANKNIPNKQPSQVIAESSNEQLKTLDEDVRSRLFLDTREKEDLLRDDLTDLDMDEDERQDAIERLIAATRFWRMTRKLVQWEQRQREETAAGRKGIPAFVEKQLSTLMGSKSVEELEELKETVEKQLSSGSSDVDVDFWENVRLRIPLYKALTRVDTIWKNAAQRDDAQQLDVLQTIAKRTGSHLPKDVEDTMDGWAPPLGVNIISPPENFQESLLPIQFTEGEQLSWEGRPIAPELLVSADEADDDGAVRLGDWEEEEKPLVAGMDDIEDDESFSQRFGRPVGDRARSEVMRKTLSVGVVDGMEGEDDDPAVVFERFVAREKALNAEDEMVLEGQEVDVGSEGPITSKYQLRKPRYFNRVRTGFEWNRYNQAHYDQDNPPPRTVQGYKFTIGYPHLLDATRTPTWRLCPSENENDGTVILRFHGGAPYEDVAFRIVKREWDFNPRRGYRNCFERGILLLHFNFKRLRYRK